MKKTINSLALSAVMTMSMAQFYSPSVFAGEPTSKNIELSKTTLEQIVKEAKFEIAVNKSGTDVALTKLQAKLAVFSTAGNSIIPEAKKYALKQLKEPSEKLALELKYDQALNDVNKIQAEAEQEIENLRTSGNSSEQKEMMILQNAKELTNQISSTLVSDLISGQTGANFMGCETVKGVGIAAIVVGVVVGIIGISRMTMTESRIKAKYESYRDGALTTYNNQKLNLENQKLTYQNNINNKQIEINTWQMRKNMYGKYWTDPNTGVTYDTDKQIAQLNGDILVLNAEIDALAYDDQVNLNDYYSAINSYNSQEASNLNKLPQIRKNGKITAIVGGSITAAGGIATTVGALGCK